MDDRRTLVKAAAAWFGEQDDLDGCAASLIHYHSATAIYLWVRVGRHDRRMEIEHFPDDPAEAVSHLVKNLEILAAAAREAGAAA